MERLKSIKKNVTPVKLTQQNLKGPNICGLEVFYIYSGGVKMTNIENKKRKQIDVTNHTTLVSIFHHCQLTDQNRN